MTETPHQPCPKCGSSDAFSYNTETGMFRCFSGKCQITPSTERSLCYDGKTFVPFTFKDIKEENLVSLEPYVPDSYRGISKEVLEAHGAYFTKSNGKETVHWVYPNAVKHRELPKTIKCSGTLDKFFGQDEYTGGKSITITEGEEDRLSVIEMMGDWPTVSVPNASPSKSFWEGAQKYLGSFEKIILSVDQDEAGDALVEKFYRIFPGKVYRVNHGAYKDANEYLMNGSKVDYKKAWWNASKVKPQSILCNAEDFLDLYDKTPDYEYVETGIEELDAKMLGLHKGAFTVVLAPTGIGKTELMRYFENRIINHSDYSVATCHGEETPLRSLLGIISYQLGINVTRKDLIEGLGVEVEVKQALEELAKKEKYYQFSIKVDDTIDDITSQVRFLATGMGADFVFIEPIQDFVSASNTSEKESLLTDLTNTLKRLAPELNVGIVVIAHANDDGEAKYCRSIVQGAAYEIQLKRDVDSDDPIERNKTYLYVGRKNRTGGGSGPAGILYFDKDSYMLEPGDSVVFDATKTAIGF